MPKPDPDSMTAMRTVIRIEDGQRERIDDELVHERTARLCLDGEPLLSATGSPTSLPEWALGHLLSEGLIEHPAHVASIRVEGDTVRAVLEPSCGPPTPLRAVGDTLRIPLPRLLALAREADRRASVFHRTGGTHYAAVASGAGIDRLVEDISRTAALERLIGALARDELRPAKRLLLLSCRVSHRLLAKAARAGFPILAAASAPTAEAVDLAVSLGITLCGFVRGTRANIYTHPWRVIDP
jgi:FdhD protein